MTVQKHAGRLAEWPDDIRHEFNLLRARGYKIKHAYLKILEDHQELVEYNVQTIYTYCKCTQGKHEYKKALEEVRELAKDKMYAHRGSRLDALVEVAEKLIFYFRLSESTSELTRLAAEIRSTMGEIRSEVDPYGLESNTVKSHFDKLLGGFAQLPDKKQNMILEDAFWLNNSTPQIESN